MTQTPDSVTVTAQAPQKKDWQAFLFAPEANWIARLEQLSRRRFIDSNLADQAFEQSLAKLRADDWARLKLWSGTASAGGFLICVFRNLLEDFAVARFGRCRGPRWLQELGAVWTTLYKRLCCERQLPETLAMRMADSAHDTCAIRSICRTIKARIPDCGLRIQFESLDSDSSSIDLHAPHGATPGQQLDQQEFEHILLALSGLMTGKDTAPLPALSVSRVLQQAPALDDDMRLLLKLLYQDGISLAKAAVLLDMQEHTARRNLKKCLQQFKDGLHSAGFDLADFLEP